MTIILCLIILGIEREFRSYSSEKVIELCKATAEEAGMLSIKRADPLLLVRSTAYDAEGAPLYAGVQLINGDRFSLYVYESGM